MHLLAPEAFGDLRADVHQSIARIKASPFVPWQDHIRGFVHDVQQGARAAAQTSPPRRQIR